MTTGEKIVRTKFNASGSSDVDEIKNAFAELIDKVEELAHKQLENDMTEERSNEIARLANSSIYGLESAAMYAVKALTA